MNTPIARHANPLAALTTFALVVLARLTAYVLLLAMHALVHVGNVMLWTMNQVTRIAGRVGFRIGEWTLALSAFADRNE
jgi:hypothetical protein